MEPSTWATKQGMDKPCMRRKTPGVNHEDKPEKITTSSRRNVYSVTPWTFPGSDLSSVQRNILLPLVEWCAFPTEKQSQRSHQQRKSSLPSRMKPQPVSRSVGCVRFYLRQNHHFVRYYFYNASFPPGLSFGLMFFTTPIPPSCKLASSHFSLPTFAIARICLLTSWCFLARYFYCLSFTLFVHARLSCSPANTATSDHIFIYCISR